MKKLVILATLLTMLFVNACQNNIEEHNIENGIYFSVQRGEDLKDSSKWEHFPSTSISFLSIGQEQIICNIKVQVLGEIKNYDRTLSYEIVIDSTTAVENQNYELLDKSPIVKAGEYFTHIPIKIFNTENILEIEKKIGLKLVPNEHFKNTMPTWFPIAGIYDKLKFNTQYHSISISNFVVKPPFWEGRANATTNIEEVTWGLFSVDKFNLMSKVCQLKYTDFTSETMPAARVSMIKESMARYLQNLYDNYPTTQPILEKDGRLMWISGCSWKSTVGTPWVPEVK